jgi:nitrate/TMAO reductase-like tetraheme cytochrome c subunit
VTLNERVISWVRPMAYLGHNPITLTGAVLTTGAALSMALFWAVETYSNKPVHPYAGIILFIGLPMVFVAGLVLIPIGVMLRRRQLARAGHLPDVYPQVDLREPLLRRAAGLVGFATLANVLILSTASYKSVEHMDSVQFCGQTCHTVMSPEYTAYANSPHSRVACVGCHIGAGAGWFVKSKLSGTRQVFAVAFGTYSRPIPSPVKHLRPAQETCEQCHWPQKFHGDKFLVRTKYAPDEKNTASTTVLVLRVGGKNWKGATGIHGRHLDDRARITYLASDDRRQIIPRVSYIDDEGKSVEYVSTEQKVTPEVLARAERRAMDCVDCHNRPTHAFDLPERALDRSLSEGRISTELPWVKKKAVELLRTEYADRDAASRAIGDGLVEFYRTRHPETYQAHRALVEAAAQEIKAIYLRNVFPAMKITWGTHPNNIGHDDFLGCFRCHDDNHKSADGKVISQDCSACHSILAMDETDPKVLADLGLR